MSDDDLAELVEIGDLDELLRADRSAVRRACSGRSSSSSATGAGRRSNAASSCGRPRTTWSTASRSRPPGEFAARMLTDVAGLFGLGPLAEVAAAGHEWADLAPFVPRDPDGGDVRARTGAAGRGPDRRRRSVVPIRSRCRACSATGNRRTRSPSTGPTTRRSRRRRRCRAVTAIEADPAAEPIVHSGVARTLRDLVHPWTADGDATTAAVRGDVRGAIGALDGPEVRLVEVDLADAIAWSGWAGASGGAPRPTARCGGGPARRLDGAVGARRARRGLAAGSGRPRAAVRTSPLVPVGRGRDRPDGLGTAVAVEDPDRGLAFALRAHDPA